jgi:cytochrome c oxidase subunit 4
MSTKIVPTKTYFAIFVSLMALLGLTIGVAYIDLGPLNFAAAMVIAVAKALLIIAVFMHVRSARKLTWVFAGAGFFWLSFLLVLATIDYATRSR